ncbi:MAG: PHP domain-containing protein [Clostridiales bacterium]|nr:PHP domain-containing protein [Clostridiales bacterium]
MNKLESYIEQLNAPAKADRLAALQNIADMFKSGEIPMPERNEDTNNHVHTTYSFSPYSPAKGVYMAYMSGLRTVGIVDHDAINGADEFIKAGEILGITTTIGMEIRVNFESVGYKGINLNNPDQPGTAYITFQGVPHDSIEKLDKWLGENVRKYRHIRNRKMVENINGLVNKLGVSLDYDKDVLPSSMAHDGGGVTERHILFALTHKLMEKYTTGEAMLSFFEDDMGITVKESAKKLILDRDCPIYDYDVLNLLKSEFVAKMFVPATDELVDVKEAVRFAKEIGAIPSICYLGDVGDSVTGDKKAQKFEDEILDDYIPVIKEIGFEALAYMPSRNTDAQIARIDALCRKYDFLQISGEDINQPRQKFVCMKLREPGFKHLEDATWALVGHEYAATEDKEAGIYSDKTKAAFPNMEDRIAAFKEIGLKYRR